MRISKKILACALSILMAISMMPFTVFAATDREVATGAELKTAVANAQDGDTIKFTADLTLTAAQVGFKVDKDLTFDLNGHTISGPANGNVGKTVDPLNKTEVMFVTGTSDNITEVVFKDSVGGGSWTYTYTGSSQAFFCDVRDYATVTVQSGTYTASNLNYAGAIFYVRSATAQLDIEDGTFNVVNGSKTDNAVYANNGTTVINGGTFNANTSTDTSVSINSSATVTFNDGDFNAKTSLPSSSTKIAVNGGTFKNYDGSVSTLPGKYTADDKVIDTTTGEVTSVDPTTVAKIDNAQYSTLEAAIAAVPASGTIKLIDDVTVASTIEITDGKNFTINTNGYDISSTVRVFNIRHGGLSISGTGTLSTTAANAAVGVYGSTNSSDANYSKFTLQTYATIDAPNGYGVMVGANGTSSFGSVVTIYGTITSKWGVYINGNVAQTDSANAAKFTIGTTSTAASISASNADSVIYAAGYANWTINNANLTGGSAIYIKSGNMTVKNGTFTANGAAADYAFNTNGCDITGDCVIIDSCGYPGSVPTVTINGGTFTSTNGEAVASYAKQDDPLYPTADFPRVDNVIPGTSTAVFSSNVTALAAEGYETTYDATAGGYVVAEDEHTVAIANGVKFDSFEEALASISTVTSTTHSKASDPTYEYKTYVADGEIKLMQDVDGNGLIIGEGSDLTIDFNGFTYDVKANPVGSNGTETIGVQLLKDSDVTFKNGTLTSTADWDVYVVRLIQNYSDLTLDNMNISMNGNFFDQTTMANCNGTVVINDSTVSAPDFSEYNYTVEEAAELLGAQVFTVGTFSTYPAVSVEVTGDSTINGNVKVDNDTDAGTAALTLTSGTLNGDIVVDDANAALEDTTVTKGAAFNQEAPEGYAWTDNGDGTASLTVKNTASLTLDGDIKLNFQLKSADAATYEIIAPDATKQALDADGQTVEGDVENGAATGSVTLAPAQLNETVTVKFYDANGSELANESFTYSGVQYAKGLAASADEKEANLGKAILKYAKAAQDAFDGSYTDAVDLSGVDFTNYTEQALSGATYKGATNAANGVIKGVSFICFNKTGLRFYYGGDSEVVSGGVLGAINGDESNLAVDVYDIESDDFDDVQTVEFADGTYIEYSVNSALYNCRNLTGTNLALATALYNYGYYSAAFFA
jgi:hypothetical protein